MASVTAAAARRYLIGLGPLFPVPVHPLFIGPSGLLGCVIVGLGAGLLSAVMTLAVYAGEDLFQTHMPMHWMWWPALGGLAIGVGGLLFPQALGVGSRHHRRAAPGRRPAHDAARHPAGEIVDLGACARVRHVGRRAGAAADDGRRARRR
jgi:H+/Cl- antiporter ClcA